MSTRYDQAINHPARREERSNFPLGTKGDKVCGTVTSTDSEPGKFARDDGTYPQIPVVTLANVEFNGQPHEGDLVLKGYHAALAKLLNTCEVNDTLAVSYLGQAGNGGAHLYEGAVIPPQSNSDMPTDPGPAAPKADDPDGDIPFAASAA